MRVSIFEPQAGGHHMALHLRHIARAVLSRGWSLHLVTTASSRAHPAYRMIRDEFGKDLSVSFMPAIEFPVKKVTTASLVRFQFRQFQAFSKSFNEIPGLARPDAVYVINLDNLDKLLAASGSPFKQTPFAGMLMNVGFHHRRMGVPGRRTRREWLSERSFRRLLRIRSLRALLTIDQTLSGFARLTAMKGHEKVRYVPDPVDIRGDIGREEARRSLGISRDQIVVLAFGTLTRRKGVPELLKALADPVCPQHAVVLLAGCQDREIRELVAGDSFRALRSSGRIREIDEFMLPEDEYRVFKAADIAWLGYRNFSGASGVLIQASRMGLPVVACKDGLIGWMTRKYVLGEIVDIQDHRHVVSSLIRLAGDAAARSYFGANGVSLAERHKATDFARIVCDAIEGI